MPTQLKPSLRHAILMAFTLTSTLLFAAGVAAAEAPASVRAEIAKRHDEGVRRLQEWVRQPAIAAENRGMNEGCETMMRLAREAGFDHVERVETDGHPAVFATLDAGAARTIGLYFMYDVKQVDPSEWSSPPFEATLLDKPGFGKVILGRGAVNQKGPQAAMLAALHAMRGAGVRLHAAPRHRGGAEALHGRVHARRRPGPRRSRARVTGSEGGHRAGAGRQR